MMFRDYLLLIESKDLPVRQPTDDPYEVMQANFSHGRIVGNRTIAVDKLNGGVPLNDRREKARVTALVTAMKGPDGYISRLIVDQNGNVIEGQHRLEALRQLGIKNAPCCVISEMSDGIDLKALEAAILSAQHLHGDHLHQLIEMILSNIAEEGSAAKVKEEWEAPRGFERGWNAALDYLIAN